MQKSEEMSKKNYEIVLHVMHGAPHLGVGDIIENNYRQPIYRDLSNYRQIIDIEFW